MPAHRRKPGKGSKSESSGRSGSRFAAIVIALTGLALIATAIILWATGGDTQTTTATETTRTIEKASPATKTTPAKPKKTTATAATSTTKDTQVTKKTVTAAPAPNVRSETVTGAMLALGGLLLAVGAFYSRISSIKFPGGAEISLAAKVTAAVAKKTTAEQQEDPAKVEAASMLVFSRLLAHDVPPNDAAIEAYTAEAIDTVYRTSPGDDPLPNENAK